MRRQPQQQQQQRFPQQFQKKDKNIFSEHESVKSLKVEDEKKVENTITPGGPSEEKMEEEAPNCINVDELMQEKQQKESKQIDLSGEKKEKSAYDIDDTIIRDIKLSGDIHVRLLSNINGYFIDIRKYQRNFPTKKGIRFLASKFSVAVDYLKQDLEQILPKNP